MPYLRTSTYARLYIIMGRLGPQDAAAFGRVSRSQLAFLLDKVKIALVAAYWGEHFGPRSTSHRQRFAH